MSMTSMRDEIAKRQAAEARYRLEEAARQEIREIVREEIKAALAGDPLLAAIAPLARLLRSGQELDQDAAARRRAAWDTYAGASSDAIRAARSEARSTSSTKSAAHSSTREESSDVTQVAGSASASARSTFSGEISQSSSCRASATMSAWICRSSFVCSRPVIVGFMWGVSKVRGLLFRESRKGGKA